MRRFDNGAYEPGSFWWFGECKYVFLEKYLGEYIVVTDKIYHGSHGI